MGECISVKKKVKNKSLKCMFGTQDCVENLGRRLQKLNKSPYRKEMKNVGRSLN